MDKSILNIHLNKLAKKINGGEVGLVRLKPETWAKSLHCYENVLKKIEQERVSLFLLVFFDQAL